MLFFWEHKENKSREKFKMINILKLENHSIIEKRFVLTRKEVLIKGFKDS